MNISDYFIGVATKTLSSTEVDPEVSNGHEFQGIRPFRRILGEPPAGVGARKQFPAVYLWLTDDEPPVRLDLTASWYDSRANQPHRSAEPRLVYPVDAEDIVFRAKGGDSIFFCLTKDERLMFMLCPAGSAIEQQLRWLFEIEEAGSQIAQKDFRSADGKNIGLAARYVLELIEVEIAPEDEGWLDRLIANFGNSFPSTARFSEFARRTSGGVDVLGDPDGTLMQWLEHEERLFRVFEKHIISERLGKGFSNGAEVDVDGFVQFSLSVQNRRKSRAGYSLENHLEQIFRDHSLQYQRGGTTEGKKKPDFLFPGSLAYRDTSFPAELLTLLGSKSSCKDRWRQVLSEGIRVPLKHLVTLEPGISAAQTAEMQTEGLQLVLPTSLHESFLPSQRNWLLSVSEFIGLIVKRQASISNIA